jgi:hypothetical protein
MDKFNKLIKWLEIKDDYLELNENIYRKVIAKKNIPNNTILFIIKDDKLLDNELLKQLKDYDKYHNKISSVNSLIALYLMQNFDNPKWSPYTEVLPTDLTNFWYYIPDKIQELIKNTKLSQEIQEFKKTRFDDDLNILEEYFPELKEKKNKEKWFRCKILVNSRIFGYTRQSNSYSGLVPIADMLNHDTHNNCNWFYSDEHQGFVMKSNRDINKGEELLDSYGSKQAIRYYLLYGFIPKDQSNDTYINIDGLEININTDIQLLIDKYGGNKDTLFNILINKLKIIPFKSVLQKNKADENIIKLLNYEKEIIKKLLKDLNSK